MNKTLFHDCDSQSWCPGVTPGFHMVHPALTRWLSPWSHSSYPCYGVFGDTQLGVDALLEVTAGSADLRSDLCSAGWWKQSETCFGGIRALQQSTTGRNGLEEWGPAPIAPIATSVCIYIFIYTDYTHKWVHERSSQNIVCISRVTTRHGNSSSRCASTVEPLHHSIQQWITYKMGRTPIARWFISWNILQKWMIYVI